jgi:hypothetical protein
VIRTKDPSMRKKLAGERPKAPLHPVADHRSADLLRNRETNPHRRVPILAVADQQDEAGHRRAPAAIRGQEISAPSKCAYADRDLRPRARRAARILRPPTVALRARNP